MASLLIPRMDWITPVRSVLKNSIVVSVGKSLARFKPDLEIDAKDKWVCPGIIDLCARFGEPGLELKTTIESESKAAASAGITAVCCPPDTHPVIDTPAVVELIPSMC